MHLPQVASAPWTQDSCGYANANDDCDTSPRLMHWCGDPAPKPLSGRDTSYFKPCSSSVSVSVPALRATQDVVRVVVEQRPNVIPANRCSETRQVGSLRGTSQRCRSRCCRARRSRRSCSIHDAPPDRTARRRAASRVSRRSFLAITQRRGTCNPLVRKTPLRPRSRAGLAAAVHTNPFHLSVIRFPLPLSSVCRRIRARVSVS